ncbi:DMT family transporter [Ureibacillus sp. MALMAid1270]|uniref:DMT family transporter n=1 Tax=Ureibacillus sp. MALMAid1270 TaxID=3411629 RepID=UPI003BA5BA53
MKNNVLLGAVLCLVAAVSWGAMFPVAHDAFKHIDPFYFTVFRYGSVTVILATILLWKEGKQAFQFEGRGVHLWFFGTMAFTVYNLFIFWGEDILGESGIMIASIMESLMPMISIIIVWMIFKDRPHLFTLLCVLVSFVGAILVITKGDFKTFLSATDQFIPTMLILIAVIGWVIYTMGGSEFNGWSALRYSTLSCLLGTTTAIVLTIASSLFGYVPVPSTEAIITVSPHLLFMIIFPGVIALLGWNIGVSLLSPLNALLFINFVPVTTLTISIFQGNKVTIFDLVGTALIIIALVSNNLLVRMLQKKDATQHLQSNLQERTL